MIIIVFVRAVADALKVIYKSVVLSKLYASPAWWSFATSADKQRVEAFLGRGVRLNLYSAVDPQYVSQRVEDTDDELFCAVLMNSHHVLQATSHLT